MNITIFDEYHPSQRTGKALKCYPEGIHNVLKSIFDDDENIKVTVATQEMPEHGLTSEILDNTDVLIYWGHVWQAEFLESVAEKIHQRVLDGMGIIFLHASKNSKAFKKLMGTTGCAVYREDGERERVWTISPTHPIADGVENGFAIETDEMYGEYFDIPTPEDVVFIGWFEGGEVMRSGCTFTRGKGKIFYFQPGHHTFPVYYNQEIRKIIYNATYWAMAQQKYKKYQSRPVKRTEGKRRPFRWK